jgi:hypothetical protein
MKFRAFILDKTGVSLEQYSIQLYEFQAFSNQVSFITVFDNFMHGNVHLMFGPVH